MTGSSGLPLVGAEVVLLGTQAFNANVPVGSQADTVPQASVCSC
jgi:hypothetical protein